MEVCKVLRKRFLLLKANELYLSVMVKEIIGHFNKGYSNEKFK